MTNTETEPVKFTARETAALMRKALRLAFPKAKISVTMSRGTGHGYMHVTYTDGPTTRQVDTITRQFQSASFDGMTDSMDFLAPKPVMVDSEPTMVQYTCYGASPQRRISPEATAWAMDVVRAHPGKFERDFDHVGSDGVNHSAVHLVLQQVDLTEVPGDPREVGATLSPMGAGR